MNALLQTLITMGTHYALPTSRYRERLPDKLTLKLGAQVILCHNIDVDGGWVNGTLASVVAMHENCIVICKMNKPSDRYPVPRFRQKFEIPGCSYSILRTQFPLQLAYAVTVHRMQGMTVQRTVVKLNDQFFASGQAYVALSRVKHLKDLVLWDYCQSSIHILKFYKDLLEWCDCVDAIRPTPPTKLSVLTTSVKLPYMQTQTKLHYHKL